MSKHQFWNIGKANAEISSAHEAADATLESAKITSLKVDGKDMPASDAPLAVKIVACRALIASGEKTQDVSELVATNGQIAAQAEELSGKLALAQATIASQNQKISEQGAQLSSANASVSELTAKTAQLQTSLDASNKEAARLAGHVNGVNEDISRMCLDFGCLDLGLKADATEAQKIEAANKLKESDKLNTARGAVASAVSRIGLAAPAAPSTLGSASSPTQAVAHSAILAQYDAIKDPAERTRFYRANASKIFSAMKALQGK